MKRPFTCTLGGWLAICTASLGACSFVLDADRLERGSAPDGGGAAADATREGSVTASGDATAEGGPVLPSASCDDEAPFTTIVEVTLPPLQGEQYTSATLSHDEQTAFVGVAQDGVARIVELTRRGGGFGDTGRAVLDARDPSLSPSGLDLHFVRSKKAPSTDTMVWVSHRNATTEAFEATDLVGTYAAADIRTPFYLASENLLYLAARADTEAPAALAVVRAGATALEGLEANSDPLLGENLVLTADGAYLYFSGNDGISRAKRVGKTNAFENVTQVEGLGLRQEGAVAPWISYDRCRLYFFSDATFIMAEREPEAISDPP